MGLLVIFDLLAKVQPESVWDLEVPLEDRPMKRGGKDLKKKQIPRSWPFTKGKDGKGGLFFGAEIGVLVFSK